MKVEISFPGHNQSSVNLPEDEMAELILGKGGMPVGRCSPLPPCCPLTMNGTDDPKPCFSHSCCIPSCHATSKGG